ncbi:hypothetical protein BDV19DRAFT_368253 [Aspergillus venezuelensis]
MMDNTPFPTQPAPQPTDWYGRPQPASTAPQAWFWDLTNTRLGLPSDGVTEIGLMEYWNYEPRSTSDSAQVLRHFDSYKQDEIIDRLAAPVPLIKGRLPSSGFQIAIVPCSFQSLPKIGIQLLDALNEALGLPNHNHHYSSLRSGAVGMFVLPDDSLLFARPRTPDFSSVTTFLRYDPKTNITRGIMYYDTILLQNSITDEKPHNPLLASQFQNLMFEFETCPHPLLLPLVATEFTVDRNVEYLERFQTTLEQMEGATGYGLLAENQAVLPDYRVLVKNLSRARSGVHLAMATLRSTQWCAEYIVRKLPFVEGRFTPETRDRLGNGVAARMLQERAEFMISTISHSLLRGGVKERLEGQHSTLFNLITQNDSLLSTSIAQDSREIAAASKRDSSSMKIIAFLTTFFLPATFVATFFSMPLFDWEKPSVNDVATGHFWVFWALTVPLTVATMVGVVAWAIWHSKATRRVERKARENFSQAVADEAMNLKRAATARMEGV